MNPNTLELITKELTELNQLRLFKSKMAEKLCGDLPQFVKKQNPHWRLCLSDLSDEDLFSCAEGLRNLSTGWDEEDPDGDLAYHHPSYNQLKERVSKLSTGLVGGGIIPLAKKSDELRLKVDALEKTIVEKEEDIQQYKDTLDEHFHHYDLLKKKNDDLKLRAPMPLEYYEDAIGNLEKEIADLKDEHEVTLHDIREYLGRFGGDEVEVFDKIVDENATIKKVQ